MANVGIQVPSTNINSATKIFQMLVNIYIGRLVREVRGPNYDTTNFVKFQLKLQQVIYDKKAVEWIFNNVDQAAKDISLLFFTLGSQQVLAYQAQLPSILVARHNAQPSAQQLKLTDDECVVQHSDLAIQAVANAAQNKITMNGSITIYIGFHYGLFSWIGSDNDNRFTAAKLLNPANWRYNPKGGKKF